MANNLSRVLKGVSQVSISRLVGLEEERIATDVPAVYTIANGIEEVVTQTRSAFGETIRGNIFISSQMPDLMLTIGSGKDNPFWHEMLFGYQYEPAEQTVPFTEIIFIPPGTGNYIRSAATPGHKRYGLEANDVVKGVYLGAPGINPTAVTAADAVADAAETARDTSGSTASSVATAARAAVASASTPGRAAAAAAEAVAAAAEAAAAASGATASSVATAARNAANAIAAGGIGSDGNDVPKLNAPLHQENFVAGPPPGGSTALSNNRFQVGNNGLMVFAPNLRGQSVSLTWEEPDVRVIRRSAAPTGFFRIILEVLDDENTIEIFDFQRVKPMVAGRTYDPSAETWEIGFYVTPFPGQCLPFQHYYTKLKPEC